MFPRTKPQLKWALASLAMSDAYTDFMLSRQAMNCTPATLKFYGNTAGKFLAWCEAQSLTNPAEVTARYVRQYLAGLADRKLTDRTLHAHARAIRTLLRFWHPEGYTSEPVRFEMPKIARKRLPRLTADQLRQIVTECGVRDKAIVLFMADSGLRRAEVVALNWSDIDFQTGAVMVRSGKGRKSRVSRIGAVTRRALLAYRRTLADRSGAVFQTGAGIRLTGNGLRQIYRRLAKRTGITVTPHAMRRTFVILSLRAGMGELSLMHLLGHTSLTMVDYYASLEDDDLLKAHQEHSPVDSL